MLKLIERIIKCENRTLEFKREAPDSLWNILKTIVSFANDAGGDILIPIHSLGIVKCRDLTHSFLEKSGLENERH